MFYNLRFFIIFISNLPFLGKVLEKVVFQQLSDFFLSNNAFDTFLSQIGFYVFNQEMTWQNQSGGVFVPYLGTIYPLTRQDICFFLP